MDKKTINVIVIVASILVLWILYTTLIVVPREKIEAGNRIEAERQALEIEMEAERLEAEAKIEAERLIAEKEANEAEIAAANRRAANARAAEKADLEKRQEALDICNAYAWSNYSNAWDQKCWSLGMSSDCNLTLYARDTIETRWNNDKDACLRIYEGS